MKRRKVTGERGSVCEGKEGWRKREMGTTNPTTPPSHITHHTKQQGIRTGAYEMAGLGLFYQKVYPP